MENERTLKIKQKFLIGYKGVFSIRPLREYLTDKFFALAFGISLCLTVFLWIYPGEQLGYLDTVTKLIFTTIPAMLGLSVAGFAIVISQINEKALERLAEVNIDDEKDYSLYQTLNAVFSVTVLAQLIPLLIAVLVSLIKPLSMKASVSDTAASMGNCAVFFAACLFFLNSLFSIIDLIQNIFTTGQIVNFILKNEKPGDKSNIP